MADIIQLLPDHVANQIAAGEVVQRPASVVKELLENAIDAGATHIQLIVKEAGKTMIRVVDNGIGMSATDARLSFERHATSKISSADDLFHIQTKGFRGEALASIAAIAHVEMQTRQADIELGTTIRIEGGTVVSQEVSAAQPGTSISVKNLFYNIPARRNFLKSNQVELRHITDEFQRVAIAHPAVEFSYINNGSPLFKLPAADYRKRIVQVFGRKMNEKLVPISEEAPQIKISGFVCKPEYAKKSRGEQFFFVNDRFIKSAYLHHAVTAAFEGLIKAENFPGYFIYLNLDPESIDINIHPTKTEIKFEDEHTIYAFLRSSIKHSLGQFSVAPVLDFEQDQNLETPYSYKGKNPVIPQISVDPGFNPFKSKPDFKTDGGHGRKKAEGWENLYVGLESGMSGKAEGSSMKIESEAATTEELFEEQSETAVTTIQLGRKYIVGTIKSGLVVIDQHRAHQRVLYEKFLSELTLKETMSQQLLFPLDLSFNKGEIQMLREMEESLVSMGFSFDEWEESKVKIKGIPSMMSEAQVGIVLDQLLFNYRENVDGSDFSQADMFAKTLCKSLAVKTGEVLDNESQMALVNNLFACKEIDRSPFNKPIFITLAEKDIENKF